MRYSALIAIVLFSVVLLASPVAASAQTTPPSGSQTKTQTATSPTCGSFTPCGDNETPHAAAGGGGTNSASSGAPTTLDGLMEWVVELFAGLVGIAGVALNVSAYYSIVKMGSLVGQIGALQTAWSTFRDLGNIVILFGFIFMGIATILDNAGYNQKKMLVTLIIVAVLINFSSLAARTVIDAGNIVGIQFYKAFNGGAVPTGNFGDNGLSNNLMDSVGLTTVYKSSVGNNFTTSYPLIAFMSIILFIIIAFVFFSIAFLLVSRFVILVFLITISPLAFAGFVIPAFTSKSREWMKSLINNTIVAPIVMLLLLISTNIVTGPAFRNLLGGSGWSSAINPTSDIGANASIIVVFMMACGFYLASLIIAKNLGAFGAATATKLGSKLSFGVTARGAGAVVGGTGRIGRRVMQTEKLKNTAASRFLTNTFFRPMEKANLDIRRIPGIGGTLKKAGAEAPGNNSYRQTAEDLNVVKKYRDASAAANKEYDAEMRAKGNAAKKKTFSAEANNGTALADDLSKDSKDFLGKLSTKELAALKEIKNATMNVAANLSQSKFDDLIKSDDLTDTEKANLRAAREKGLKSDYGVNQIIPSLPPAEVGKLPASVLTDSRVLGALDARRLAAIDPDSLKGTPTDPTSPLGTVVAHLQALRAIVPPDPKWTDFARLMTSGGNARKWRAII